MRAIQLCLRLSLYHQILIFHPIESIFLCAYNLGLRMLEKSNSMLWPMFSMIKITKHWMDDLLGKSLQRDNDPRDLPSSNRHGIWVPGVRRDDQLRDCVPHSANGRHGKQNLKETARLRSIKLSGLWLRSSCFGHRVAPVHSVWRLPVINFKSRRKRRLFFLAAWFGVFSSPRWKP